jgi:hypothetical protein
MITGALQSRTRGATSMSYKSCRKSPCNDTMKCSITWYCIVPQLSMHNRDSPPSRTIRVTHDHMIRLVKASTRQSRSFRPLTTATFRINYLVNGLDPGPYHVVNVALHALASSLVAVLAARIVPGKVQSEVRKLHKSAMLLIRSYTLFGQIGPTLKCF